MDLMKFITTIIKIFISRVGFISRVMHYQALLGIMYIMAVPSKQFKSASSHYTPPP